MHCHDVAFSSAERDQHLELRPLSPLNTQPMASPVNASPAPSRVPAHHSGPGRLAKPFPVEDLHLLSFASFAWRTPLLADSRPSPSRFSSSLNDCFERKLPVRSKSSRNFCRSAALHPVAAVRVIGSRQAARDCDFNRSTQHFIKNAEDGVYANESKESSRCHGGRESGVVRPLEASRGAEVDWASVWRTLIVYLSPVNAAQGDRNPSGEN